MSSCGFKWSYVPDFSLARKSNFLEFLLDALKLYIKDKTHCDLRTLLLTHHQTTASPTDFVFVCSSRTKGHAEPFYKVDKFACLVCVCRQKLFT